MLIMEQILDTVENAEGAISNADSYLREARLQLKKLEAAAEVKAPAVPESVDAVKVRVATLLMAFETRGHPLFGRLDRWQLDDLKILLNQ